MSESEGGASGTFRSTGNLETVKVTDARLMRNVRKVANTLDGLLQKQRAIVNNRFGRG